MAAVLGGTQSLHTNSKDEALALPSQEAAKIALRTQQIIGYESGVTKTVDPMAGSYYMESLCDEIEEQTLSYLKKNHRLMRWSKKIIALASFIQRLQFDLNQRYSSNF